jgi:P-type Cu+ transporter
MIVTKASTQTSCYHCGEPCTDNTIMLENHDFCCTGCRMVFQLLNKSGLCTYYELNNAPGANQRHDYRSDKFAFLDDEVIRRKLVNFSNDKQTNISLYLPQIHCSSCLYLLENLHSLNKGIMSARVDFAKKEIDIVFNHQCISLRTLVETLTKIGYEPYLSLGDLDKRPLLHDKKLIYKLGVAGFCFANIMLLSFPEYLGLSNTDRELRTFFSYLSLVLALPVVFFSAQPFFYSGFSALKGKFLNIDAPIALAILVTFCRSLYEIIGGEGSGYLDSMSGIVFFMLTGRVLQERSFRQLSFDRNFTSYFPIAVTVARNGDAIPTSLPEIKVGDTLIIHNEELIPADGILTKGKAMIDYSFVTGEALPVHRQVGDILYAGGKHKGAAMEILLIKEVSQSYLTRLWSRDELRQGHTNTVSFVHKISQYFTYIVFAIAIGAGVYWAVHDSTKILNVITAVLIIACPCALLLSNSFTNGYILRILARNKFYLRDAQVIEDIAGSNHIVFDKTGTLTNPDKSEIRYSGKALTVAHEAAIIALTAQSTHPLSKAVNRYFNRKTLLQVSGFREIPGQGIQGWADCVFFALGSKEYITGVKGNDQASSVYLAIQNEIHGVFTITNPFRPEVPKLISKLSGSFRLSVISGDNRAEELRLQHLFGQDSCLMFHQSPEDKLEYIKSLQQKGTKTIMIGDGLNDAGALKQSSVGIAVSADGNNFTPASDAIIDAAQLSKLHLFISLCRTNKLVVKACFIISILYNLMGLYLAVRGSLSPLVAAVLMPASSLSILLISYVSTKVAAKNLELKR